MTNTKHFRKWVCNAVKTLILLTVFLGIALGISTSYDLDIMFLAVVLIVAGFFFASKYNESNLFKY